MVAVPAKLGDINIVQIGLGTVIALIVATVRARVDGLRQNAAFRESRIVKAGQVLAEIDPQPLKVAWSQVEGQLAQDSIAKQQLDSGRLGLRQMDAGNNIRASDTAGLAVITQVAPIKMVFAIPQDNLPRLLKQLKSGATLGLDTWDRGQKNKLAAGFLLLR